MEGSCLGNRQLIWSGFQLRILPLSAVACQAAILLLLRPAIEIQECHPCPRLHRHVNPRHSLFGGEVNPRAPRVRLIPEHQERYVKLLKSIIPHHAVSAPVGRGSGECDKIRTCRVRRYTIFGLGK